MSGQFKLPLVLKYVVVTCPLRRPGETAAQCSRHVPSGGAGGNYPRKHGITFFNNLVVVSIAVSPVVPIAMISVVFIAMASALMIFLLICPIMRHIFIIVPLVGNKIDRTITGVGST
ncbi:MAG: hypothetical protein CSYNP_01099 [Syntrophus sp. SKADARSKE-3]|nr:hypothetical protein [Syntrophus sp. SKADARSKE-3]